MWFEIFPSALIIATALAFPHASAYVMNYFVFGNMYRRSMYHMEQRRQYLRDRRLTKDPYKVQGLESIPDEEDSKDSKDN